MAEIDSGKTEEVSFKSKDGTEIHGLLTKPVGYQRARKCRRCCAFMAVRTGRTRIRLSLEAQLFAANGYAVLAVNYRGSDGRGLGVSKAIAADWGHLEVEDLKAGVDKVIQMGRGGSG